MTVATKSGQFKADKTGRASFSGGTDTCMTDRVKAPFLWRPCDHDCV